MSWDSANTSDMMGESFKESVNLIFENYNLKSHSMPTNYLNVQLSLI